MANKPRIIATSQPDQSHSVSSTFSSNCGAETGSSNPKRVTNCCLPVLLLKVGQNCNACPLKQGRKHCKNCL